jgi:hypothetical protein
MHAVRPGGGSGTDSSVQIEDGAVGATGYFPSEGGSTWFSITKLEGSRQESRLTVPSNGGGLMVRKAGSH